MQMTMGTLHLPHIRARDVGLVLGGAALLVVCAPVQLPMWPVPITLQSLVVLLVGAAGGAVVGVLAVALYLVMAALGLPVLADGWGEGLGNPASGYLIGYLLGAAGIGFLARRRGWNRGWRLALALIAATVLIYVPGILWLDLAFMHDWAVAVAAGVVLFLPGDIVKLVVAYLLLDRFRDQAFA